MTLTGFRPLLDFMSLRDAMDRLFEESFVTPGNWYSWTANGTRYMPLDIYETNDDIVVRAVVPGVTADGLDVQYQHGVLTLRARSAAPEFKEGYRWLLHEIAPGETVRQVTLPREIDVDRAQASFENGILNLVLPKTEEAKPKQIRVSTPHQIGAGS
ncbi:MAG: Hsp20/alpha crystallin family protein [Chloroflexota bacterium]|nr:Hsp20/alpha crystallin family protein [Chloroflexota bacterium]